MFHKKNLTVRILFLTFQGLLDIDTSRISILRTDVHGDLKEKINNFVEVDYLSLNEKLEKACASNNIEAVISLLEALRLNLS